MRVWRLVNPDYAPGLDGEGARLYGGRWNSAGRPAVYCAASVALATLEAFVNLPEQMRRADKLPPLMLVGMDLDDTAVAAFPSALPDDVASRTFGDAWLAAQLELALSVPSRVVPYDRNILINPLHSDMARLRLAITEPFVFDPRLTDG